MDQFFFMEGKEMSPTPQNISDQYFFKYVSYSTFTLHAVDNKLCFPQLEKTLSEQNFRKHANAVYTLSQHSKGNYKAHLVIALLPSPETIWDT